MVEYLMYAFFRRIKIWRFRRMQRQLATANKRLRRLDRRHLRSAPPRRGRLLCDAIVQQGLRNHLLLKVEALRADLGGGL